MLLNNGTQERYISETTLGAGTTVVEGSTKSDSILVSLFVASIVSGNLTLVITTLTDENEEVAIITYPNISSGTTNLLLRKSAVTFQRFKITATYDDVCTYKVYVRAVDGAGAASATISGSTAFTTSKTLVGSSTPTILIPFSLDDRNGMSILNTSPSTLMWISEDSLKLPLEAYPIYPGQSFALDVSAGVVIYAIADSGTIDIRIAQAGG